MIDNIMFEKSIIDLWQELLMVYWDLGLLLFDYISNDYY
jgi:hypothetical protein